MSITALLAISLGAILTNNFIFAQFLGICPFLGVSKKIDTAVGMGAAVTFVMGLASAVCFGVNKILIAFDLGFMQTVAYILVIAGLVQFVEMFLKKNIPTLYTALGVYLPLITTNCAVLGVALLNVQNDYSFIGSVVYGITGGLGFLLAIFLFAAVREQLEVSSENPKAFDGFPHRSGLRRPDGPGVHGLQRPEGLVRRKREYEYFVCSHRFRCTCNRVRSDPGRGR